VGEQIAPHEQVVTPLLTVTLPPQLSMVVLSTRDLPALRRFYDALGWTELPGGSDELARFRMGELILALYPATPGEGATPPAGDHSAMTLVISVATAAEVDSAFAGAVHVGAEAVSQPQDQSWGGRSAVIADPEGNRWEILWVPRPSGG